jgi:hypothetical protein
MFWLVIGLGGIGFGYQKLTMSLGFLGQNVYVDIMIKKLKPILFLSEKFNKFLKFQTLFKIAT